MTPKNITIGLVVVALVAIAACFLPVAPGAHFGAVSPSDVSATNFTEVTASNGMQIGGGGLSQTSASGLNTFAGTSVFTGTIVGNNVINGGNGYAMTLSTANGTSQTITAAQFCNSTSILIPVTSTTTLTITLPAATSTFATCGAVAGSWSTQIIENDSGSAVTLATTTGETRASNSIGTGGTNFLFATGTSANGISYPPKIQASTTATVSGMYTSSSSIYLMLAQFNRPPTY